MYNLNLLWTSKNYHCNRIKISDWKLSLQSNKDARPEIISEMVTQLGFRKATVKLYILSKFSSYHSCYLVTMHAMYEEDSRKNFMQKMFDQCLKVMGH